MSKANNNNDYNYDQASGDQLTYLEVPFYNSNCSKPNKSASLFGEAQLNNNRFRSAEMAWGSRSQGNVSLSTVTSSKLEQPASPEETPAASDVGPSNAPVFAPVPVMASTEGLFQKFLNIYLEN